MSKSFQYDKNKCLGTKFDKLLLLATNDHYQFLVNQIGELIESNSFDFKIYEKETKDRRSIKIFIKNVLNGQVMSYNAMKRTKKLVIFMKLKSLWFSIISVVILPYLIVTVGKFSSWLIGEIAFQLYYIMYSETRHPRRNHIIKKAAATLIFIFFSLIGLENVIQDFFGEEAVFM